MITKLMQFVSQLFRSSPVSSEGQPGRRIITGSNGEVVYDSWKDRDRPLEQIINEGSLGKIEDEGNFQNCFQPKPKTKAELDREYLIKNYDPRRDLAVMSETTFGGILALKLPYPVPDGVTLDMLSRNIILIPGVINIGIVKG